MGDSEDVKLVTRGSSWEGDTDTLTDRHVHANTHSLILSCSTRYCLCPHSSYGDPAVANQCSASTPSSVSSSFLFRSLTAPPIHHSRWKKYTIKIKERRNKKRSRHMKIEVIWMKRNKKIKIKIWIEVI